MEQAFLPGICILAGKLCVPAGKVDQAVILQSNSTLCSCQGSTKA